MARESSFGRMKDAWLENTPLQVSFPSLFALVESKEAWVRDYWNDVSSEGGWNPSFTRSFNDWEVDEAESLLCRLGRYTLDKEGVDRVRWKLSNTGVFAVKSMYKALQLSTFEPFPWQMIWRSCVQPKISFFTWEAAWGRILTLDKLQRRGVSLANRCFPCQQREESVDHLLFHCSKTRVLWELLFSLFGAMWIMSSSVREMFLGWKGAFVGKRRKKVWQTAPSCLFWTV